MDSKSGKMGKMGKKREKPSPEPSLIFVDSKEESQWFWSQRLRMFGWNVEVVPLDYGDFKFFANGKSWPVERKAVPSDLEGSFVDGRLSRQVQLALEAEENPIILLEGNLMNIQGNFMGIMSALFEAQCMGALVDFCKVGEVVERLTVLKRFLDKQDHSFFRKPTLPLPSKYEYKRRFDGGINRFEQVRTLMTFKGVSEDGAVETLKRYTLQEVFSNPDVLMQTLPGHNGAKRGTVNRMKMHLGIDAVDMSPVITTPLIATSKSTTEGTRNEINGNGYSNLVPPANEVMVFKRRTKRS